MTRLRDVARRAGVSTATTSRVLSGKGYVSDELRQRVLHAVEELNYIPHGVARSMSEGRTRTLGLVVSDITNPFFTALARGVEDVGQENGYTVILCNTDEQLHKEKSYLAVLREKRVDGLLLASSSSEVAHIQRLVDAGTHIVLIDRPSPELDVPSVAVDNVGGAMQATEYLLALGHRRIGIMSGRPGVSTLRERVVGYLAAHREFGVPVDERLIVPGWYTERGGFEAGMQFCDLPEPPTAILSTNNVMTTGLLLALRERSRKVPEEFSIVGFDDLPYFSLLDHPLTVVAQPMYEMGRVACELLLRVITGTPELLPGERDIRLPTHFVIRDSCRPITPSGVGVAV